MSHSAFFYGTLLHPSILRRVIGHQGDELQICPALLLEHTRHKVKDADYPGVIPYTKSRELVGELAPEERCVRGTLVTGLVDSDIELLDLFEGDQYTRKTVSIHPLSPVQPLSAIHDPQTIAPPNPPPLTPAFLANLSSTHPPLEAQTYVWCQPLSELRPDIWEFGDFVRECAGRWVGDAAQGNPDYVAVDERRAMGGRIVHREIVVEGEGEGERRVVVVEDGA